MAYFAGKWSYFRYGMPLHPFVYVPLPETYSAGLPGLYLEMGYLLIHDKFIDRAFRNVKICGKALLIENGIFIGALAIAGDHGLEDIGNPLGYRLDVLGFKLGFQWPPRRGCSFQRDW